MTHRTLFEAHWVEICQKHLYEKDESCKLLIEKYELYWTNVLCGSAQREDAIILSSYTTSIAGDDFAKINFDDEFIQYLRKLRDDQREEFHRKNTNNRKVDFMKLCGHYANKIYSREDILRHLDSLLSRCDKDEGILFSLVGKLFVVLESQIQNLDKSVSITIPCESFFERSLEVQSVALDVYCSLGFLDVEGATLTLAKDLSNQFLKRLCRMIRRSYSRHNISSAVIDRTKARYKDDVTITTQQRTNALGEHDSALTNISNSLLPCAVL